MTRRTLYITLGSFLGIILVGVLIYTFFIRGTTGGSSQNNAETPIFGQTPGTVTAPGGSTVGGEGEGNLPGGTQGPDITGAPPRLHLVAGKPTAGATVALSTSSSEVTRYVERESGHLFEVAMDSTQVKRITNTTIPKIYGAEWVGTSDNILLRLFDDTNERIQTFLGKISTEGSAVSGSYLEEGILSTAISPNGKNIFYLRAENGGVAGVTTDSTLVSRVRVFTSPLSEWLPLWLGASPGVLTKPSGNFPGFLYRINAQTAGLERVLGDINGLTALSSPDGKRVLYSQTLGSSIYLNSLLIGSGKTTSIAVSTLPEKCVWSVLRPAIVICAIPFAVSGDTNGVYPDLWYQGRASFSDNLWQINTDTGAASILFRFSFETKNTYDATSLHLSPKEDHLIFTNKKDLTLWSVRLGAASTAPSR